MINRELIRLKIVQLVYAYYQNVGKSVDVAEKELFFSLSKAYDLYNYLLLLMVEVTKVAERKVDVQRSKVKRLGGGDLPSTKFIDNRFVLQLETNKQLLAFREKQKKSWEGEEAFISSLHNRIIESEVFRAYMAKSEDTYTLDREFWRKVYKTFIFNNEELDAVLEEMSLYWNDDKEIVDSFVLKTIKRFDETNGSDQELLPEFDSEDDRMFASRLFRNALTNAEVYRDLIKENCKNWEFNRLAFMDVIIMQVALCEMLSFPGIPLSVTFNEYLDIAKIYSTPHSASYINGMLDHIVKRLKSEKKLIK